MMPVMTLHIGDPPLLKPHKDKLFLLSVSTCNIHEKQDSLSQSRRDIRIEVLHEIMGIIPDTATHKEDGRCVDEIILSISRRACCNTFDKYAKWRFE